MSVHTTLIVKTSSLRHLTNTSANNFVGIKTTTHRCGISWSDEVIYQNRTSCSDWTTSRKRRDRSTSTDNCCNCPLNETRRCCKSSWVHRQQSNVQKFQLNESPNSTIPDLNWSTETTRSKVKSNDCVWQLLNIGIDTHGHVLRFQTSKCPKHHCYETSRYTECPFVRDPSTITDNSCRCRNRFRLPSRMQTFSLQTLPTSDLFWKNWWCE